MARRKRKTHRRRKKGHTKKRRRRQQRGGKFDIQRAINKFGVPLHWPGFNYMGPGTPLQKHLKRGVKPSNRLDTIAMQHDLDYSKAKSLQDKWKADHTMIQRMNKLKGKRTLAERVVPYIMRAKVALRV